MEDAAGFFEEMLRAFQERFLSLGPRAAVDAASPDIFFLEFLEGFLPRKYGVAPGYIIGKGAVLSGPQNVIIYDGENAPVLRRSEKDVERILVPAESVICVVFTAPVFTVKAAEEIIGRIVAFGSVPGLKNDAFAAFFAFSPPELKAEGEIITYINEVNNAVVKSGVYRFLRFGCVLPHGRHGEVESATGAVPCYEYLKSKPFYDDRVPPGLVKEMERVGSFELARPETVLQVFLITLLDNLAKWTPKRYGVLDYFAGL